jgi:hypothetical protein
VDNNDKGTVKRFADGQIAADARVVTDGHSGYDAKSLGKRPHEAVVQTKAERRDRSWRTPRGRCARSSMRRGAAHGLHQIRRRQPELRGEASAGCVYLSILLDYRKRRGVRQGWLRVPGVRDPT